MSPGAAGAGVLLFFALASCGAPEPHETPDADGDAGRLHFATGFDAPPAVGAFTWRAVVAGLPSGDVTLDACTATFVMPAHSHAAPGTARISLDGGTCVVDGLSFHMPGAWLARVDVSAGGVTDGATFSFRVP